MVKKGTGFEKLTEEIFNNLIQNSRFEKVERNVWLEGKDGKREIDVLLTTETAGFILKTIVECKDHKRKISIGALDSLHSKLEDVNANKGILISSKGFSTKAISKAKRLGITLCTAHEAVNPMWDIDIELPILIREVTPIMMRPGFNASIAESVVLNAKSVKYINGIDVHELFITKWSKGEIEYEFTRDAQVTSFDELVPPLFVKDKSGIDVQIMDFQIIFALEIHYYFGYINKMGHSKFLNNITDGKITILADAAPIFNYQSTFTKYRKEDLPKYDMIIVDLVTHPDIKIQPDDIELKRR